MKEEDKLIAGFRRADANSCCVGVQQFFSQLRKLSTGQREAGGSSAGLREGLHLNMPLPSMLFT